MAKYSKLRLQAMAQVVIDARNNQDPRYFQLVLSCAVSYGDDPRVVEQKIERMARGDFDGIEYR